MTVQTGARAQTSTTPSGTGVDPAPATGDPEGSATTDVRDGTTRAVPVRALLDATGTRVAVAAYGVLALVHLAAQLADAPGLSRATQVLLMPTLAAAVWTATRWTRGRQVRWLLAGLGLSWLGDSLPGVVGEDLAFLVMVGFFLLAQVAYVVAFVPDVRRSVVHRRPVLLLPYALVLAALMAACAPGAGDLLVPVAVYGGVLTAAAVLATGLGRVGAVGGVLFLVSDGLIALNAFVPGWDLPRNGSWVMLTYVAAQALLALAVVVRNRAARAPRP